jgi:sulfur carrier protein
MTIRLNGDQIDSRGATNIAELVERYQLAAESILIEHNGLALHRNEWKQRALAEGDRIEFIRVVAGG